MLLSRCCRDWLHVGGDWGLYEGTVSNVMSSRSGRWPMVRKLAWDRDRKVKAPCHICGQPINYHLEPSTVPDSWEPDHLVPVCKDKSLELDLTNILPSHRRCNRARGDGTNGTNDIGRKSRVW